MKSWNRASDGERKALKETARLISMGTSVKSPAMAAILDTITKSWCENRSLVMDTIFSEKAIYHIREESE